MRRHRRNFQNESRVSFKNLKQLLSLAPQAAVFAACLLYYANPVSAQEQQPQAFMGTDMTLYFNGGTEDQVLSAGTVFLFNLPVPKDAENSFDPIHRDIAAIAQRLGNDVAIVPLKQVWPVADERSRRWIRLMRCPSATFMEVTSQVPILYVSVSSIHGRACVMAKGSGPEIAQLTELLLDQEEHSCRLLEEFQTHLYRWVLQAQNGQKNTRELLNSPAVRTTLQQGQDTYCKAGTTD